MPRSPACSPNKSGGASVYGAAAWVRYSQVHRAALGVVQLARLDAGAGDRLRHRRGLHPQRAVPARSGHQDLGNPAARSRVLEGRTQAPAQLDLLHRRDPDRDLLRHPASRHSVDRQGADHRRRGGAAAAAHHRHRAVDHRRRGDAGLPALRARHRPATAAWNKAGWTLFFGGLFIAAWSAYAFETAICYTSEFRNPATDTYKAILYSGLLCIAVYILVPLSFQGALGSPA